MLLAINIDVPRENISYAHAPPNKKNCCYHVQTEQLQQFEVVFDIHIVISPKHLEGRRTVDWTRWRHNNTAQRGPAPRSCTCQGRPWRHCL